ncbi:MAG: hypothetical protein OEZ01_03045 [Candidatus Heimdallarchaeota archaeon]|nr:hypothetical protein [Candidatus Heimdallarchaeota archaeon]MDH5644954.1 hypothetical protein [Candidatus Heimdallarchaeota archaeon]
MDYKDIISRLYEEVIILMNDKLVMSTIYYLVQILSALVIFQNLKKSNFNMEKSFQIYLLWLIIVIFLPPPEIIKSKISPFSENILEKNPL